MPATKQNTTESAKRKLSLIRLAGELGNVSKACEITGYSRQSFYDIRRAFQVGGMAAFVEKKRGPKNPHPNRVAKEIEENVQPLAAWSIWLETWHPASTHCARRMKPSAHATRPALLVARFESVFGHDSEHRGPNFIDLTMASCRCGMLPAMCLKP